jgi:hypothetical protein
MGFATFRLQQQDAPQAMNFRFPPAFRLLLYQGAGLG